jgi:hypothetical protein
MSTRRITVNVRWILGALVCLGSGTGALFSMEHCDTQPLPRCQVESLPAVASYTPIEPPQGAGCDNWVPPSLAGQGCGSNGCSAATPNGQKIGEIFGMESYFPSPNDSNQNSEPGSMAIQLGYLEQQILNYQTIYKPMLEDAGLPAIQDYPYSSTQPHPKSPPDQVDPHHPYAWGPFDTVRPVNGICTVSNVIPSDLTYPELPFIDAGDASQPEVPQTHVRYEWSNFKVVIDSDGGSIGQQVFADLKISQDGPGAPSCSQRFHVALLAPQTSCTGSMMDDAGNPLPDNNLCSAGILSNSDNYPIIGDAQSPTAVYGSGLPQGVPVDCMNIFPPAASGDAGVQNFDFECLPRKTAP